MASDYTADIIKIIIRGIVQECAVQGEAISESLAIFILRIVTLDPEWTLSTKENITEESIRTLIKACAERLLVPYNPTAMTLKMQVYFELNYKKREEFLKQHHHNLSMKLMPVLRTITNTIAHTTRDLDVLYHQVIVYLLLRTGMGNPRDAAAVKEAKTAAESVFPLTQLQTFMLMSKKDKRDHLEELAQIVAGIRLYNREIGKGGATLHNVVGILIEAAPVFADKLKNELDTTNKLIKDLTEILEYHVLRKNHMHLNIEEPETNNQEDHFLFLKRLLANAHQYRIYLEILLAYAVSVVRRAHELQNHLKARLQNLHSVVQTKCTIVSREVFPIFVSISQVWSVIQEEVVLLSTYSTIARNLRSCAEGARGLLDENDIKELLTLVNNEQIYETQTTPVGTSDFDVSSHEITPPPPPVQSPPVSDTSAQFPVQETATIEDTVAKKDNTLPATDQNIADTESTSYTPLQFQVDAQSGGPSQKTVMSKSHKREPQSICAPESSFRPGLSLNSIKLSEDSDIRIIFPDDVKNFHKISLQYQGFCPWAMVCGQGVLMLAERDLGIVLYEGCCFAFCCKDGGEDFMQKPQIFIKEVTSVARKFPELILLLHMHDYFHVPTWYTSDVGEQYNVPIFISDSGTQTEIHPVASYKDFSYKWNEWDLRKLALKVADVRQRETHSTQTNLSHFRRENHSQVYLPKPNWSQTKRDGSTTMPKPGVPELVRKVKKGLL